MSDIPARPRDKGPRLVEFAMVMPIILLVVLGLVQTVRTETASRKGSHGAPMGYELATSAR